MKETTTSEAPVLHPTRGVKEVKMWEFFKGLQLALTETYRIHLSQQQRPPSFRIYSENLLHRQTSDNNLWDSRNKGMEIMFSDQNERMLEIKMKRNPDMQKLTPF